MKKYLFIAIIFITIFLLSSCQTTPSTAEQIVSEPSLENTRWQVIDFSQSEVATSGKAFIEFRSKNKSVTGLGGCNRFVGGYTKINSQITLSRIATTRMMCLDMSEERTFIKALTEITNYKIKNQQLVLLKGNKPIIIFKKIRLDSADHSFIPQSKY